MQAHPGPRLPDGWDRWPRPDPPRLEANCTRHGSPFAMCDACASIPAMARWANGLSDDELRLSLLRLADDCHWFAPAETRAVLTEAARRIQPG